MAIMSPSSFQTRSHFLPRSLRREVSSLGHNVGLARICLGMSAAELSAATGGAVSARTITALESGRQSDLSTTELIALCDVLEVWPHELCSGLGRYYA